MTLRNKHNNTKDTETYYSICFEAGSINISNNQTSQNFKTHFQQIKIYIFVLLLQL